MSEDRILAIVNGREIKDSDVNQFITNLGPQRAAQFNSEDGRKKVLQELIQRELLYSDAKDNKYDESEEFVSRLEYVKIDMLKQYAIYRVLQSTSISDEEVNDYYKQNRANFFRDTTLRASHILVDEKEKAENIKAEIENGLTFEEAAKKYSTCASKQKDGDLGYFSKGKMVKEFEDAAFNLEIGDISEPVESKFGYHIIKLTDKKDAGIIPFNDIKDNLKRDLLKAKQNYIYNKKIEELKSKYTVELKGE